MISSPKNTFLPHFPMKFLSHNERKVLRFVLKKRLIEGEMIKEKNFISAQKAEYRTSFIVILLSIKVESTLVV